MATFPVLLAAQPFNFDLSFAYGTPKGSFQQTLDRDAFGLDAGFTYQVSQTPIHLGVGMTYQNYGWRERSEYFSPAIQEVKVRVRTTNNMVTPHLIARLEPDLGFFSPFVEGTFGFNYLYTESSIVDDWDDEEVASTVNHDYVTSNSGIGAGIKLRLYEGYDADDDFIKVSLIIKTRFMLGGEADYLREGDLVRTRRGLEYNLNRSRTDIRTFNVGFVLNF
jgi:hypothetical protein